MISPTSAVAGRIAPRETLKLAAAHGSHPVALATALTGLPEIFGDLADDERIRSIVADRLGPLIA